MSLEIVYFGLPGRVEPTRLALTIGGVEFKNTIVDGPAWGERKAEVAPRQLPLLYVDGKPFGQSLAMLRYAGQISKYEGNPLYPTDPLEAFAVDEMVDYVAEVFGPMGKTFGITDQAEKEAARAKLVAEGGDIHKWLKFIDGLVEKNGTGFAVGGKLSIADLALFSWGQMLRSGWLDGMPTTCLDEFKSIMAHKEKIASIPQVKEYYKDAEGLRKCYQ